VVKCLTDDAILDILDLHEHKDNAERLGVDLDDLLPNWRSNLEKIAERLRPYVEEEARLAEQAVQAKRIARAERYRNTREKNAVDMLRKLGYVVFKNEEKAVS